MEAGSFPIQFQIHNGPASLCSEAQTRLFFMSIWITVRLLMSAAVTWEILDLSSQPPQQTSYVTLFKAIPLNWQVSPLFVVTLLHVKLLLYFEGSKVWKLGKKKTLTSHIFHNWKCCLHLVSPSLSLSSFTSLVPPLSFCWMFAWMAYHTIWIPPPYQKQGTSALKNDRHTAGGIKAMQNWNLRGS